MSDYAPGDEFSDDAGTGTRRARILSIDGDEVHMEMWNHPSGKNRKQFTLDRSFISLKECGWVRISQATKEETAARCDVQGSLGDMSTPAKAGDSQEQTAGVATCRAAEITGGEPASEVRSAELGAAKATQAPLPEPPLPWESRLLDLLRDYDNFLYWLAEPVFDPRRKQLSRDLRRRFAELQENLRAERV